MIVMKTLVLSGINLFQGGALSIYYDCLDEIEKEKIYAQYHIIAFVHKKELFKKYEKMVEIIELPESRKSYIKRLKYEYSFFYQFSIRHRVDVWVSLHDITPRVKTERLYTYCHNAAPFMKRKHSMARYSMKNIVFTHFYKYLYRINIRSADAVIVQQEWMRDEFLKRYPVKEVIVARPDIKIDYMFKRVKDNGEKKKKIFVFPSFPRNFKNFEVICEACQNLCRDKYEVWFTLDGSENTYSRYLKRHYGEIANIKWIGLLPREKLFEIYDRADCLIFPSVLETWGLPISEFKLTGKEMILADLPYAHETLGGYEKCMFFDPNNAEELKKLMESVIENKQEYMAQKEIVIQEPYAADWKTLLKMILI